MSNLLKQRERFVRSLLAAATFAFGVTILGCSNDTTDPVPLSPTRTFWAFELNAHAVNLALTPPYNTIQLSTTARSADGTILSSVGRIQYSDPDSSVTVDSAGFVTAHFVTGSTQVVATMTMQGITLTDTAFIRVTQAPLPAPLTTFSIHPRPDGLDSAKYAVDGGSYLLDTLFNTPPAPVLSVYATVTSGTGAADTVCNVIRCALMISFASSDSTIATINRFGDIAPIYPGRVTFYARTLAYGIAKQDSLPFTIGYPITNSRSNNIQIQFRTVAGRTVVSFEPSVRVVGVEGVVVFNNPSHTPVDVAFDRPATVANWAANSVQFRGNIVQTCDTCRDGGIRLMPVAETLAYHSRMYGTGGILIVSNGP